MTGKDPKDMTASELLRWLADNDDQSNCQACSRFYASDECGGKMCSDWKRDLADKIDAEIVKAYSEKLDTCAMRWAKANGWPDFREGEDFGAWLDRCAIPRPRFEDGEPVHIGDKAEHPYTGETCTIDCINTFDDSYCLGFVGERSASLCDGERVKRPAPEAMGADGKPIKVGDTVWNTFSWHKGVVKELNAKELKVNGKSTAYVEWSNGRWSPCIRLDPAVKPPLT